MGREMVSYCLGQGQVAGSCKHGKVVPGCIICREFCGLAEELLVFKKRFSPWCYLAVCRQRSEGVHVSKIH
jgi:hypothetical protein